ncbi:MAG: nucleoside-triphosphatase [bacterium]|nr:MAG: nucleoside-triphosphatase [bacterium]
MTGRSAITNILVTGPPGCGKSTLVMRLTGSLPVTAGGFTTAEIRSSSGSREGFKITTLYGTAGILAHKNLRSGPRVGRYRVNIEDLETIGAAEIEEAIEGADIRLIVVDEIARMELFSERFRRAVLRALDSPKPLLGTIQIRRDPFLDAIRSRSDTIIIHMSPGNRSGAEDETTAHLRRLLCK